LTIADPVTGAEKIVKSKLRCRVCINHKDYRNVKGHSNRFMNQVCKKSRAMRNVGQPVVLFMKNMGRGRGSSKPGS